MVEALTPPAKKRRRRAKKGEPRKPPRAKKPHEDVPPLSVDDPAVDWDPENHGAKRANSSDPIGRVSIFEEQGRGIPSFDDVTPAQIFEYVDRKAQEIGAHIPQNRGVPATVSDHANMLSREEKAIVILGRAIGVPYRHVVEKLNEFRDAANLPPITSDPVVLCHKAVTRHKEIVAAIQTDMLVAVEEWSPLVSGQQRYVWRARILQLYAATIKRLAEAPLNAIRSINSDGDFVWLNQIDEIRRLDKAMSAHMAFFDKLGVDGNLSSFFAKPSERMAEQNQKRAEAEIEEAFAAGRITEVERLNRIRTLRHGASE